MLKSFVEGLLIVYFALVFIFLIAGNMCIFGSWLKGFEKRKKVGAQYDYLKFWGEPETFTGEELEELHQMLEQFEKKHDRNC